MPREVLEGRVPVLHAATFHTRVMHNPRANLKRFSARVLARGSGVPARPGAAPAARSQSLGVTRAGAIGDGAAVRQRRAARRASDATLKPAQF
jgi:hypothetical protein